MNTTTRRAYILEQLAQQGNIRVTELATVLQVDPVTIRRDLEHLEAEGHLQRVHGGAVIREKRAVSAAPSTLERRIAETAARFIPHDEVVFLGPGRLTLEMTLFLGNHKHLTVITNALDVAYSVARTCPHTLHLLGGQIEADLGAYGPPQELAQVRANWVVLEAGGLDAQQGLTHDYVHYAAMARALVGLGAQLLVLLPPERVGRGGAVFIAPAEEVDILITGREAANAPLWDLSEVGVRIVLT